MIANARADEVASLAAEGVTSVTPWVEVEGVPAWAGSEVSAYRIHSKFDGRYWLQRHEWRKRDGSSVLDEWIFAARKA